jgi:osmoprotectant transport system ATP-binding protein
MIEIENLTKQYGSTTVVDRVSISIARGSITVIVGTSGSGKSTLLRMINRLVEPTSGRVLINGHDTTTEPAHLLRRRIGYAILLKIFQLDPSLYAGKFPHQLSGGQQQRVGVARAFAAEPTVLLMDEPFGALDPIIRAKAQDDLRDIQRRFGTTIVLVTHDIDEAFRLGDRVAVMSQGQLLQYDRPAALLVHPADPFISRLTGTGDRAMKLLSLTTAGEAAEAGSAEGPTVAAAATLRDVLSELLWSGAAAATVINADGTPCGRLTLGGILAHGRPR